MAETAVKNQICQHCGAEVRPNTQFCYNCGGSLATEIENVPIAQNIVESNNGNESKPTSKLKLEDALVAPIPKPEVVEESKIEEETKLKSAATMRRKSKVFQPKRVEVIWEEYENAPDLWFVLAAVLLTLLAIGIFYMALYLK